MDISWWSAKVIESSNFFWAGVSMYLWYRCSRYKAFADKETGKALSGLQWMFMASALNHGWFAVSRHLKDEGSHWNAVMFEWRGFWVLMTALLFVYGSFAIVQHLEGAKTSTLGMVAVGMAVLSFSAGFF